MVNRLIIIDDGGVPTQSLDFEASSSQYLSMSAANFGAYDYAKFSLSMWINIESISDATALWAHETQGAARNNIYLGLTGKLNWDTFDSTTYRNTRTATTLSTGSFIHLLFHYDSANATSGDRKRIWIDGVEVTSFDLDHAPTSAITAPTGDVWIGNMSTINTFDGLIYYPAFFTGVLVPVTDVRDSGTGAPKDVSAISGLHSVLDVAGGSVVSDAVLATDWTNNNKTVTTSSTIP